LTFTLAWRSGQRRLGLITYWLEGARLLLQTPLDKDLRIDIIYTILRGVLIAMVQVQCVPMCGQNCSGLEHSDA